MNQREGTEPPDTADLPEWERLKQRLHDCEAQNRLLQEQSLAAYSMQKELKEWMRLLQPLQEMRAAQKAGSPDAEEKAAKVDAILQSWKEEGERNGL